MSRSADYRAGFRTQTEEKTDVDLPVEGSGRLHWEWSRAIRNSRAAITSLVRLIRNAPPVPN